MPVSEKLKQLLRLLADANFHSGTELAAVLGVSRSAIWKHLRQLAELGLDLISVPGKGYRLSQPMQLLDKDLIHPFLDPSAAAGISELEIFDILSSTNTYLSGLAATDCRSGRVCLAECQTAGKGRRGKQWISPYGHNIYLSVFWRYHKSPADISGLSLALGVAVIRALQRFGLTGAGLKWPNDIFVDQQKLAGILVEVAGESGGPCHAVIGLGVNFYLPPRQKREIDQPCVDLCSLMGDSAYLRRNELVGLLLNGLMQVLTDFEVCGISEYVDEWRLYHCMTGKSVMVNVGLHSQTGIVRNIDNHGHLLLETESGKIQAFASGEVSVKPV